MRAILSFLAGLMYLLLAAEVRAHGGFIEVKSEVGRGSAFAIALPARGK